MQSHRYQSGDNQVHEHPPAEKVNNDCIEDNLNGRVVVLKGRWRLGVDYQGTDKVKERLQAHPAEFSESCAEKFRLQERGQVGIDDFVALIPMVLEVVLLERH